MRMKKTVVCGAPKTSSLHGIALAASSCGRGWCVGVGVGEGEGEGVGVGVGVGV